MILSLTLLSHSLRTKQGTVEDGGRTIKPSVSPEKSPESKSNTAASINDCHSGAVADVRAGVDQSAAE